uniref:Uncharacterized protein n=1 Tax=Anguilla anguilla TaxID=7936 RepID=A0A0E9XWX6_ANGAN
MTVGQYCILVKPSEKSVYQCECVCSPVWLPV